MRESEDHVEFKKGEHGNVSYNGADKQRPADRRRCILAYVTALCNEGGGRIVIGMHDDYPHHVVGTWQCKNAVGQLEADIYRDTGIRPDVYELYESPETKEGRVLVIEVPGRPVGKLYKYEDVPLMRVGEELKPMSDAMFLKILQESEPDFSAKVCDGLTLEDLDEDAIREMKVKYANKWNKPEFRQLPTLQVLSDFKLITSDGGLTYAALILLGKSEAIYKHLSCDNVVVEYRLNHSMIEYTARKEFREPLFLLVDHVWDYINQPASNPLQHYRDRFNIYDLPTFNEDVVREAILNSICHRVMYIQSDIVIKQYPDMLMITNAGGFPVGVDKNNILTVNSMPRLKLVSEVLQKTGLVEKSGQGVDKMYSICISEGKQIPDYSATDDFQVCLKLRGTIKNPALLMFIQEEQLKRGSDDRLNAFDLLALYRISRGESVRDIDSDTINRLLNQNLIIETDGKFSLCEEYEEMKRRTSHDETANDTVNGNDHVNDHVNDGVNGNDHVNDHVNDGINGNDHVNDHLKLANTEIATLNAINSNKELTHAELIELLGKSQSTITRSVRRLRKEGLLVRIGSDKTGSWRITDKGMALLKENNK